MIQALFHWFEHGTGMTNVSDPEYGFWSGFGSDIQEFFVVGAIIRWAVHHNCHVKGCWRLGRHPFQHYKLCGRHHPAIPHTISFLHIAKLHKESK